MIRILKISMFLCFISMLFSCNSNKAGDLYKTEIENWQQKRLERLKSKTGWLNLAGLYWLKEGQNSIGSDSSNSIIFPVNAPAFCGTINKNEDSLSFIINPDADIKLNGETSLSSILLSDASSNPTIYETGSLSWFIIKRGGDYGIRLRDFNHPRIEKLDHIPSYETDPGWKKHAKFIRFDNPDTLQVATMTGGSEDYEVPGKLVFRHNFKKYEILPFKSGDGFFIIIGDKTSAKETYAAGRFMYTDGPDAKNRVILDFNKAYNPPCAFSPFATCPLPPPENRLDLAITAGEKAVHLE